MCYWAGVTTCTTICSLVVIVLTLGLGIGSGNFLCYLTCGTTWFYLCDTVQC